MIAYRERKPVETSSRQRLHEFRRLEFKRLPKSGLPVHRAMNGTGAAAAANTVRCPRSRPAGFNPGFGIFFGHHGVTRIAFRARLASSKKKGKQMNLSSHLQELRKKHQDLSMEVETAQRSPAFDDLEITALKKQKLKIKEEIERLSHQA